MDDNATFSKEVLEYIIENEHLDPYALALKKSPFPTISMKLIAQQVQGRKIAKKKFPFLLSIQQFQYPKKESLEQASSETTGKYKSNLLEGESFVDLTGGMGIDTYLLGRKFNECTYVEPNLELYTSTKRNLYHLGLAQCSTFNKTCEEFLNTNALKFDWIYIDPSRRVEGSRKTSIHNYVPNIVELQDKIKAASNNILVKLSPMQDISECLETLEDVYKIWVLSVQNEVKELLLQIKSNTTNSPLVLAIDINSGQETVFSYPFDKRQCPIETGEVKKYLYQPSAAVVKAELSNHYSSLFGFKKLNENTQLYTSDNKALDYFGRLFLVREKIQLTKRKIKNSLPELKANIICKNYPMGPQDLKRKYHIKDGGEKYLIAYTDFKNRRSAVICERIK